MDSGNKKNRNKRHSVTLQLTPRVFWLAIPFWISSLKIVSPIIRELFSRYDQQTPCTENPRKNGGSCFPTFIEEEYNCNCASGYSGKRCEMGGKLWVLSNLVVGFVTATKWILIKGTKIFLNFNWPKQTRTRLQLKDYKLHTQLRAFKGCNFLNLFCSNYFLLSRTLR